MYQNKHKTSNRMVMYRRRMGFSQERVAHLLGYPDGTTLSSYENGRRLPPLLTALRLGIVLRVPVEFLFPELYDNLRNHLRQREEDLRRITRPKH